MTEVAPAVDTGKVTVRFVATGNAPILKKKKFKVNAQDNFGKIVSILRGLLGLGEGSALFCYIGQSFIPTATESLENLHACFKESNGELNIQYALVEAYG
eukprot:Clim_evm57s207 gene=Clim_evmTU57s207